MWDGPMELEKMIRDELSELTKKCEECEFEDGACETMKGFIRLCGKVSGITGMGFYRGMQMVMEVMNGDTTVPRGTKLTTLI